MAERTTHTPGPWLADLDGSGKAWPNHSVWIMEQDRTGMIGEAYSHTNIRTTAANAVLMAAAPALLAALRGMMDWARRVKELCPGPEIAAARSAITAAEGAPQAATKPAV